MVVICHTLSVIGTSAKGRCAKIRPLVLKTEGNRPYGGTVASIRLLVGVRASGSLSNGSRPG